MGGLHGVNDFLLWQFCVSVSFMVSLMYSHFLGRCAGRVVASLRLRNRSTGFEQSMKELIKQATILAYLLPSHTIDQI